MPIVWFLSAESIPQPLFQSLWKVLIVNLLNTSFSLKLQDCLFGHTYFIGHWITLLSTIFSPFKSPHTPKTWVTLLPYIGAIRADIPSSMLCPNKLTTMSYRRNESNSSKKQIRSETNSMCMLKSSKMTVISQFHLSYDCPQWFF